MEINALGSYLKDLQSAPLSQGGINPAPGAVSGEGKAFAGILDRLQREQKARAPAAEAPAERPAAALTASRRKTLIDKTDKLYEQCEALETFLVKTLISSMRNTVQKTELIDSGFAGKMYEDMLYDEYAKGFTRNAGFGLADMAYLELTGQRGKVLADHA
jgi:flagellar protein FlgJ